MYKDNKTTIFYKVSDAVIVSLIGLVGVLVPSYLTYKEKKKNREKEEKIKELEKELTEHTLRSNVVDRLLDITYLTQIRKAVENMFKGTKADRFLILIALNGKIDFNLVSVVFEQHKKPQGDVNAIARYRNLTIDSYYREMLKKTEKDTTCEFFVKDMPEDSLLKSIYEIEGVKYSKLRHLLRVPIDDNNDVVVFSSISTKQEKAFTNKEKTIFLTQYDSTIIPLLKKMLEH